jgi:chromodomain-helicase-DNA-binding protein 1
VSVGLSLPRKTEFVVPVPLSPLQVHWYRLILTRDLAAAGRGNASKMTNTLSQLRKCSNHP